MKEHTVPVFLVEFDRVDVTISLVRDGRELERGSTGGALFQRKIYSS